jgi:hypothetical protein
MDTDAIFTQFEELYRLKNLHGCYNPFIKDGIIDHFRFNSQHTKILFIAKEHNYLGTLDQKDYKADYREWWNLHVHLQFSHRISEWAYGILNSFDIDYEQLNYEQKHEALRSIAFINVKKVSGNSSSNPKVICDYIIQSRELLHQQITEISPTLIICCFRHDYYTEHLFGLKLTRSVTNAFSYGKWNNINVINFYHPSSRKNKQLLYGLIEEAVSRVKED